MKVRGLAYNYYEIKRLTRALSTNQTVLLLAAVLAALLDLTEGAKGSLRAGVMSRTNMRRKHNKYYDSSWDGNG